MFNSSKAINFLNSHFSSLLKEMKKKRVKEISKFREKISLVGKSKKVENEKFLSLPASPEQMTNNFEPTWDK
jgi:hypothetical protein